MNITAYIEFTYNSPNITEQEALELIDDNIHLTDYNLMENNIHITSNETSSLITGEISFPIAEDTINYESAAKQKAKENITQFEEITIDI